MMGLKLEQIEQDVEIERRQRRLEELHGRMDLSDHELDEFMDLCEWRRRMQEGTLDEEKHPPCYCSSLPGSKCDFCSGLRKGTIDDFREKTS